MIRLLCILLTFGGLAVGVTEAPSVTLYERPVANVPVALRQANWLGSRREGSCCHASLITALRWQGRDATARWWKSHHGDGETPASLAEEMDDANLRYAVTIGRRDVRFLEDAVRTRRGCLVAVDHRSHMVFLAHLDAKSAGLIDNNDVKRVHWVPRDEFLTEWFASDSWAVCVLYTPVPPLAQR